MERRPEQLMAEVQKRELVTDYFYLLPSSSITADAFFLLTLIYKYYKIKFQKSGRRDYV